MRLSDGERGLAARTIRRRLASVSGLFNYLVLCGERSSNPVPCGMANRRTGAGGKATSSPLIRTPRTLPRVLDPGDVIALLGAVRRWRDRAMVEAMVLGGLRCCEVIGLRLEDLQPTQRRVFIVEGKGGHQRVVPLSAQFFASVSNYLSAERPSDAVSDRLFVSLKGARRGEALLAAEYGEREFDEAGYPIDDEGLACEATATDDATALDISCSGMTEDESEPR